MSLYESETRKLGVRDAFVDENDITLRWKEYMGNNFQDNKEGLLRMETAISALHIVAPFDVEDLLTRFSKDLESDVDALVVSLELSGRMYIGLLATRVMHLELKDFIEKHLSGPEHMTLEKRGAIYQELVNQPRIMGDGVPNWEKLVIAYKSKLGRLSVSDMKNFIRTTIGSLTFPSYRIM